MGIPVSILREDFKAFDYIIDSGYLKQYLVPLSKGPCTEEDLVAEAQNLDTARERLAHYVSLNVINQTQDGRYRFNVPLVTEEEDALLADIIDAVCEEMAATIWEKGR